MKKHTGACHCKRVAYEVELDLSQPVLECNCSHCSIKGIFWQFTSRDAFNLLKGEEFLTEYLFNTHKIKHQFCKVCGTEPFAYGEKDGMQTVAINVRTINDVDLESLTRTPVNGKDF